MKNLVKSIDCRYNAKGFYSAILATCTFLLVACSGGSDSASNGNSKGTISVNEGKQIAIQTGSYAEVKVALENGKGVAGQAVLIASQNPKVATVLPAKCVLSSDLPNANFCTVKVHGHSNGQAVVTAVAEGYDRQQTPAIVSAAPSIGTLQIMNSQGTYSSSGPVNVTFPATGSAPYNVSITGQLNGSSGLDTASDTAYITYSVASGGSGVSGLPNQCQVTTQAPSCTVTFSVNSNTAAPVVTASVAGAAVSGIPATSLPSIPINIAAASGPAPTPTPTPTAGNGTITIATQSTAGTQAYPGINMPLFVNWTGASTTDSVSVGLTITPGINNKSTSSPIQFYWYVPGNTTMQTNANPPQACTLSYTGVGSPTNCAYGLWVDPNAQVGDSVTISAPSVTTSLGTYTFAPMTLTIAEASSAIRSVTFTNNSTQNIYVGITGGGGWSYKSPTDTSIPPGTPSADIAPGAVSACGLNDGTSPNYTQACPMGSTCRQAGAVPQASVSATPFYCYYDQGTPVAGNSQTNPYEIAAGESTTLSISGSSVSPGGMIWSGNFFGRAGNCDPGSGNTCAISCNNNNDGGACSVGTGASPGMATLAELTFVQGTSGTDYYDVSIINGVNLGVSFGPTAGQVTTSGNTYNCGVAGTKTAGASNFAAASLGNLPNATWVFSPSASNFPSGASLGAVSPASYYRYVVPSASSKIAPKGQNACNQTSDCISNVPTDVCGYSSASINSGPQSNYNLACGAPVAWITADTIWGFNQTASNNAPFMFTTNVGTTSAPNYVVTGDKTSPTPTLWTATGYNESVGDYQLCINQTYSGYLAQPQTGGSILACGGVMWGNTQATLPSGAPATGTGSAGMQITYDSLTMQSASTNWLNYVLPTITWLKQACPTCYTYAFDDKASTFTCNDSTATQPGTLNYEVKFSDVSFQ